MKQSLNLKLSQHLSLTPQLKQSLKLLQLTSVELEQEIQTAIDNNPLLERDEELPTSGEGSPDFNNSNSASDSVDPSPEKSNDDFSSDEDGLNNNISNTFHQMGSNEDRAPPNLDKHHTQASNYLINYNGLIEHLSWQIQMTNLSQRDKLIANTLLHSIDEDAYLRIELEEVAGLLPIKSEIEVDEIQAVLSLIKTLDPIGVGARNLQDRLTLLLEQIDPTTMGLNLAKRIVDEHMELLAHRDLSRLKQMLSVKDDELAIGIRLITNLEPHISSRFSSDSQNYVSPDVIVRKKDGIWAAELNPDNQCRLRVNEEYANLLKSKIDQQTSEFIQKNLSLAKIYIKGLLSRYDTLLLVTQAIVEHQSTFFEDGDLAMRPLILHDIAQQLEMHESTISRAISGKYLLAGGCVYDLKYFFSSALTSTDGSSSSSTAVRALIKKMVNSELKTKPLSDSKLTKELEKRGHIVARRTVAKYRESMLIAPSSQRRELS